MITRANAFFLQRRRTFTEYLWKAVVSRHQARQIAFMSGYIKPGSLVLDIGANAGFFARGFARAAGPDGVVIAFEPQSVPRSILTVASFFKPNRNIIILPFALGETAGTARLTIPFKSGGNVGINLAHGGDPSDLAARFETRSELVAAARLDDVMAAFDFGPVSLIKVDVEGAELSVLKGGEALIRRDRPVIICEVDRHGARFGATPEDLAAWLAALGYRPHALETGELIESSPLATNTVFKPALDIASNDA